MRWSEKDLEKVFVRSLDLSFPGAFYMRKTHPDKFEGAGKPDFVGHILGVHVEVELKVSPNRPTPEQKAEIRKVIKTGGFACVLLHERKEDCYYMILGASAADFSYRERDLWIKLLHNGGNKKTRLINMKPLGFAIMGHKNA